MSGRRRFFIEGTDYPESREVILCGEEFVHARTVQRVSEGSEIVLLDGSGTEYSAIVSKVEKNRLVAHITGAADGGREPTADIYLLCGALKGDKTELVVQKATELGVSRIGIFSSDYCAAYINANKLERLKKVAREAAKQCMRSRAPEVVCFDSFSAALQSAEGYPNRLFAYECATSPLDMTHMTGAAAVVVGSEGGFSAHEAEEAEAAGFSAVSLGRRILRAETAAIALTALVAYFSGEMR